MDSSRYSARPKHSKNPLMSLARVPRRSQLSCHMLSSRRLRRDIKERVWVWVNIVMFKVPLEIMWIHALRKCPCYSQQVLQGSKCTQAKLRWRWLHKNSKYKLVQSTSMINLVSWTKQVFHILNIRPRTQQGTSPHRRCSSTESWDSFGKQAGELKGMGSAHHIKSISRNLRVEGHYPALCSCCPWARILLIDSCILNLTTQSSRRAHHNVGADAEFEVASM